MNARPHPSRREPAGVGAELQFHQGPVQRLVDAPAEAPDHPLFNGQVLDLPPGAGRLALDGHDAQAKAQPVLPAQGREEQHVPGVAEGIEPAAIELPHLRQSPAQAILQPQLVQKLKVGMIVETDEVIVALQLPAIQRKAAGQPAQAILLLVQRHVRAGLEQIMGRGQAGHPAPDDSHGELRVAHCSHTAPIPASAGSRHVSSRHCGP